VHVEVMQVRDVDELPSAVAAAAAKHGGALVFIPGTLFASQSRRIVELVAAHRLPAIYPDSRYVRVGGLLSYGPNVTELYRQAAGYVDRIMKGAPPGSLPVGQPTNFELAVNLETARLLGIPLSPEIVLRADIVVK